MKILLYVIDVKICQRRYFKKMVIIVWNAGKNEYTLSNKRKYETKVFPGARMPESNPLGGVLPDGFPSVTVCPVLSLFTQVTVVPTGTVSGEGL